MRFRITPQRTQMLSSIRDTILDGKQRESAALLLQKKMDAVLERQSQVLTSIENNEATAQELLHDFTLQRGNDVRGFSPQELRAKGRITKRNKRRKLIFDEKTIRMIEKLYADGINAISVMAEILGIPERSVRTQMNKADAAIQPRLIRAEYLFVISPYMRALKHIENHRIPIMVAEEMEDLRHGSLIRLSKRDPVFRELYYDALSTRDYNKRHSLD